MVICCAAVNCSNRQGKGEKRAVSFHRFPLKDSKRLIQWLKAVQRDNWTPTKYSFLCSEHFTKDSFSKRLEDQHRLLKPTAVPSIFHLSEKKRGAGGHGPARRKTTGAVRGHTSAATGKGTIGSSLSSSDNLMTKPESRKLKRASPQDDTAPKSTPGAVSQEPGQSLERTPGDQAAPLAGGQEEAQVSATEADHQKASSSAADAGGADKSGISMDDFTPPGSGACKFIGSLHSYSFSSKHTRERPSVPREPMDRKRLKRDIEPRCSGNSVAQSPPSSSLTATPQKASQSPSAPPTDVTPKPAAEAVQSEHSDANPMSINEVILSEPPGVGTFPTLQPFQYLEEVHISHVGQPMLNFSFNSFHPETHKPMHRECGFIRLKPDTNKVAFVSAQNTGIVEVEEGEVNGQELCVSSHSISRISFAKEPHVQQITRKFRLNSEGKLEQTVSMATTTQPMTQHLHITYKKVTP